MNQEQAAPDGSKNTPAMDEPRVGVYICHCGGNISDVVDVESVVQAAAKIPGVAIARRNMFMCSDPGQKMIEEDIAAEKLDRIVVAACSPSLHELTFRSVLLRSDLNPYLFEHANIREQVSWVSKGDPEGATQKAIRLVGAAVGKAKLLRPLEPIRIDASQNVLVIGGGITGLRCARDLSRQNLKVVLLESTPYLGGHLAELTKIYPSEKSAHELLHQLISEVVADPNIIVHTSAEVTAASGCVGDFQIKVSLRAGTETGQLSSDQIKASLRARASMSTNESSPTSSESQEISLHAGAIILATGFDHYQPVQGEYGYKDYPGVITLPELNRILDEQGAAGGSLEVNGRPIKNMCLIHCVGSRQVEGIHEPGANGELNKYCSRVCCTSALWAANQVRARFPDVKIYDLFQDIRTYGRGHEDYYEETAERGVLFLRYTPEKPPVVETDKRSSQLIVRVTDTLTFGWEIEVPVDLVVLVTGLVPHNISQLVDMLKLPRSADRFLQEVHPKLRPVELSVSGVLIAGTCQAPMDSVESTAAASAAAAKAAAILGKGYIELEPFVARVDPHLCEGTGACVKECEFVNAVSLVEVEVDGQKVKRAQVNAALCRGCGMCTAVCPTGAIQVEGWRHDQFEAMVNALVADYA